MNTGADVGEVWANMLHNVYAALVAKHGYAQDAMTNPCGGAGNVIFMHLFIDSLSLLPCYPDCEYPHFFFERVCNGFHSYRGA